MKSEKPQNEPEMIQADDEGMWLLATAILEQPFSCFYCKDTLLQGQIGGIFGKPNRMLCKNIACMIEEVNRHGKN